jgi:hypothetical protein
MQLKCNWCIISKKGKNMLFHLHDEDFDENLSQELVILLIRTFLGG